MDMDNLDSKSPFTDNFCVCVNDSICKLNTVSMVMQRQIDNILVLFFLSQNKEHAIELTFAV